MYTKSGAQFINLGDPANILLVANPNRNYMTPNATVVVTNVATVVLRAAK